jgi:hypothetical protein
MHLPIFNGFLNDKAVGAIFLVAAAERQAHIK